MQLSPRHKLPPSCIRLGVIAALLLLLTIGAVVAEPPAKAERVINYEFIGPDRAAKGILTQLARGWMADADLTLDDDTTRTLIIGRYTRPLAYARVSKTTDQTKILSREAYRDFNWLIGSDDGPELNVLLVEKGTTSTTVLFIPDIAEEALGEDSSLVAANINSLKPRWRGANRSGPGREIRYEFITPNLVHHGIMESNAHYWMEQAGVALDDETSRTMIVGITSRLGVVPKTTTTTAEAEILPLEQYREFKWPVPGADDEPTLCVLILDRGPSQTTVLYVDWIGEEELEADTSPVAANVNAHNPRKQAP